MKKILAAALTVCLVTASVSVFAINAISHTDTTPYNWYVKRNSEHKQPACDSNMSFIEGYDAYYVDENATDDDKVIYLTFDAGYENGNIAKILDVLAKHNAPAAFFILSHLVEDETELVKRMVEDGHLVCNHTASHRDMTKITDCDEFKGELQKMCDIMKEKTGYEMDKYYRPPEGRFNELNLKHAQEAGYDTVFWSFAYADWDNKKQPDQASAIEKILANIHNGEIMLLHPTSETNAEILDRILTALKEDGYRFGSLDEINNEKNS